MNLHVTHVVRLRNCSSISGPAATSPDLGSWAITTIYTSSILLVESLCGSDRNSKRCPTTVQISHYAHKRYLSLLFGARPCKNSEFYRPQYAA